MGAAASVDSSETSSGNNDLVHAIGSTISGIVTDMASIVTHQSSAVEQVDILFAMKALALCKLSYSTLNSDPAAVAMKLKWIEALKIDNFKCWYDSSDGSMNKVPNFDSANLGIEAVTGVLHDVCDDLLGPIAFVCFRGNVDPAHMASREELADIISVELDEEMSAFTGAVSANINNERCFFLQKYRNLKQLCLTRRHANANDANEKYTTDDCLLDWCCKLGSEYMHGLLICGHSLGGAMASLFAAEVYSNYGDSIPIHLITFGAPKVFSSKTAVVVNQSPYRNLRFCNNYDLVQSLGAPHHKATGKTCRMVPTAPPESAVGADQVASDTGNTTASNKVSLHKWVGIDENKDVKRPGPTVSNEAAIESHSLLGDGGYFDSIIHSSTYQQALDKLYNKDVKESYDMMHSLLSAERNFHFFHSFSKSS